MKSNWKRNSLIYIVIIVMAILLISLLRPGTTQPEKITLSQVIEMSQNKEIDQLVVDGGQKILSLEEKTDSRE